MLIVAYLALGPFLVAFGFLLFAVTAVLAWHGRSCGV